MTKKDSIERGYMTKEEIMERAKNKCPHAPYSFLRIFVGDNSYKLSQQTRENAYRALQDLAREEVLKIDERIKTESNQTYRQQLIESDKPRLLGEIANLDRLLGIPDRKNWQGKNPHVFREGNVGALKRLISQWHGLKPDYIFLSETSSIPYGYAIKQAWKEAYPNEDLPRFYRIESWTEKGHIAGLPATDEEKVLQTRIQLGIDKFLNKRVIKKDATILLFDEYDKPMSPHRISSPSDAGGGTFKGPAKEIMERFPGAKLYYAGTNGLSLDFGRFSFPTFKYSRVTLKRNVDYAHRIRTSGQLTPKSKKTGRSMAFIEPLENVPREQIVQNILKQGYNPTGRTIKDPKRRKMALQYIQELKEIGEESGRELRAELEKQKSLEQKVSSVVAIAGLASSFFFLGSSVTGNAIGSISQSSSGFIGIGLLAIGLIAGFFWLKTLKKNS